MVALFAFDFGCKVTTFSLRARSQTRDKCVKIDTLTNFLPQSGVN